MNNVITFRPRAPQGQTPVPPSPAETRRIIEQAAQAALDTADGLLEILDRMDGDTDRKAGGEAEPSLSTPENHHGSQVGWLRNNDSGREAETPATALPILAAERSVIPSRTPTWGGAGYGVSAAGVVLFDMVAGR